MAGNICAAKRFTLADILLFCWLDFGALVGQQIDPANSHVKAWFDRVAERASIKADPRIASGRGRAQVSYITTGVSGSSFGPAPCLGKYVASSRETA